MIFSRDRTNAESREQLLEALSPHYRRCKADSEPIPQTQVCIPHSLFEYVEKLTTCAKSLSRALGEQTEVFRRMNEARFRGDDQLADYLNAASWAKDWLEEEAAEEYRRILKNDVTIPPCARQEDYIQHGDPGSKAEGMGRGHTHAAQSLSATMVSAKQFR